jgi:hypothetical protein
MTGKLIMIDIICEVGKSLEILCNVIPLLSFWHCTPLGEVIKSSNFWLRGFYHSVDWCIGWRHFIVATLF